MYKGLFWLTDGDNLISYKIRCDADGVPETPDLPYNSRRGNSFTHKATWETAVREQSRAIRAKDWNHFPRGRVEIKNGKAVIYHNPAIGSEEIMLKIRKEFDLTADVPTVRFVPDYSLHYRAVGEQQLCTDET